MKLIITSAVCVAVGFFAGNFYVQGYAKEKNQSGAEDKISFFGAKTFLSAQLEDIWYAARETLGLEKSDRGVVEIPLADSQSKLQPIDPVPEQPQRDFPPPPKTPIAKKIKKDNKAVLVSVKNESEQTIKKKMEDNLKKSEFLGPQATTTATTTKSSQSFSSSTATSTNQQQSTSQTATTSQDLYPAIMITEVQTESASSSRDEFVELFNPTRSSVDLTGWYLQKKTKSAATASTFVSAALFEGKHISSFGYLVISHQLASVAGDIRTTNSIADDNTALLKNPDGEIADKVGWGEAGNCRGACAPNPPPGASIARKKSAAAGGFVNTSDNRSDFEINSCPDPAGVAGSCPSSRAGGSVQNNPSTSQLAAASTTTTATTSTSTLTIASSTAATESTSTAAAFNATSSSASSSTQMSQTTSSISFDDTISSTTINASTSTTSSSTDSFPDELANQSSTTPIAQNQTSTLPASSSTQATAVSASSTLGMVISEIRTASVDGVFDHDLIALYNNSAQPIDVSGWKLRKRTKTGSESSIKVFPDGSSVAPHALYLWANSTDGFWISASASVSSTQTIAANNSIALLNSSGSVIDAVAWGSDLTNPFVEDQPFPENPEAGQKLTRFFDDQIYADTNSNQFDFSLQPAI